MDRRSATADCGGGGAALPVKGVGELEKTISDGGGNFGLIIYLERTVIHRLIVFSTLYFRFLFIPVKVVDEFCGTESSLWS